MFDRRRGYQSPFRLLWAYVMRMDVDRTPRILVLDCFDERAQPKNTRRGRPLKTWMQCVREDLGRRGYGLYSAKHLAMKSRDTYRLKTVFGL